LPCGGFRLLELGKWCLGLELKRPPGQIGASQIGLAGFEIGNAAVPTRVRLFRIERDGAGQIGDG
jgi:hypothetical protein